MRLNTIVGQLTRIYDELAAMHSSNKAYYSRSIEKLDEISSLANKISGYALKLQREAIVGHTDTVCGISVPMKGDSETDSDSSNKSQVAITVSDCKAVQYDISHRPTQSVPVSITDSNIMTTQGAYEETEYSVNDNLSPNDMDEIRKMSTNAKSAMCRQITSVYHAKLLQISKRGSEYDCINQLSKLIWDWYSVRIIKNRQYNCKFRYSVRRIKTIIYSIIIAYGYHLELGDVNNFVLGFYDWLKTIGVDPDATDKYASPYEVYDIEINHTCIYANVTAMVLSDLLWDFGFSEIRSPTTAASFIYFSPHGVSMLIEELSPTIAEKYRDYRVDPDVITEVGIA